MPEVLSISELRVRLSGVVDELPVTGPVFAGSHRKPQVVLLSVGQYEALTRQVGVGVGELSEEKESA